MPYDLLTIGHSNLQAERFMALLTSAGVTAVADVRSVPFSRWCPWFSGKALAERLPASASPISRWATPSAAARAMRRFIAMGLPTTRPWPRDRNFAAGLARVIDASARQRVCLLCAEREPLDCHRCLLVGRALCERGLTLGHIRPDGTIEPHAATE